MTAYRFVTLTCDGCGEISDEGGLTIPGARQSASRRGWTFGARRVRADLCGVCSGTHKRLGGEIVPVDW